MYVCMYVYIYVYIRIYVCVHAYMCIYIHTQSAYIGPFGAPGQWYLEPVAYINSVPEWMTKVPTCT